MNSKNQELLNQIEYYKKLIINTKEEKLRIDLEMNKTQKTLKEFEEKKELRRRELLNELIPVREEDFIARTTRTAPVNKRRSRPMEGGNALIRNVKSADPGDYNFHEAIQQSIQALPGISEQLQNSDMIEMFRQSYARDLKDFLKLREKQLNTGKFQKVDLNYVDSTRGGANSNTADTLFPGANFSFKKRSNTGEKINPPTNTHENLNNEQMAMGQLQESEVTNRMSDNKINMADLRSKTGNSQQLRNSKRRVGKKPKINFKSSQNSMNQFESEISEGQADREQVIEQIDDEAIGDFTPLQDEATQQFQGEESEMFDPSSGRQTEEPHRQDNPVFGRKDESDFPNDFDTELNQNNIEKQTEHKEHEIPTFRNENIFPLAQNPKNERLRTELSESRDTDFGQDISQTNERVTTTERTTNNDTYGFHGTDEVEKYWNDPNYHPSQYNDRTSRFSNNNESVRSSYKRSREFRISSSGRRRNSRTRVEKSGRAGGRPVVHDPRMEAFTPKLETNAIQEGEILKNFGGFGDSEEAFVKKSDDEVIDYFDNYDEKKLQYSGQEDYSKNDAAQDQNFEDTVSQNFTERNNKIIDRFDDFFGRMGIKDKVPELTASRKANKAGSSQQKVGRSGEMSHLSRSNNQRTDTNSSYSRPPSSLEASKDSLMKSKNSKLSSNKFTNYNTNRDSDDNFKDSVEERDTISEQFPPSANKYGVGSRIQSHYTMGERSELVDDEVFEVSQGTREPKQIFKNNLYKTGKSNRYGMGDLSESVGFEETFEDDDEF